MGEWYWSPPSRIPDPDLKFYIHKINLVSTKFWTTNFILEFNPFNWNSFTFLSNSSIIHIFIFLYSCYVYLFYIFGKSGKKKKRVEIGPKIPKISISHGSGDERPKLNTLSGIGIAILTPPSIRFIDTYTKERINK